MKALTCYDTAFAELKLRVGALAAASKSARSARKLGAAEGEQVQGEGRDVK